MIRVVLPVLLFSFVGCSNGERRTAPAPMIRGAWLAEHGGKSLVSDEAVAALRRLKRLGVRSIAVGPEIAMPDLHAPVINFGEDDEPLRQTLRSLHREGFQIFLLPRIESPAFFEPPYPFRGDIVMDTAASWSAFHATYRQAILHYARIAAEENVEMMSVGLEYLASVTAHPEAWRRIIRDVRGVYPGQLTYSANWWKEWEAIEFWDELDFIGIGAYFGVADHDGASVPAMIRGWEPVALKLEHLSRRVGRPVLFTEVGFTTFADAGRRPWKWTGSKERPLDPEHQAACFEALFRSLAERPWFAGTFIWRFYTDSRYVEPWEYTPEHKPAERVIERWYRQP